MKKTIYVLVVLLTLFVMGGNAWAVKECKFDKAWLKPHPIPTTVPDNGNTLCDFHQYEMEHFLSQTYWGGKPDFLNWMSVYGVFNSQHSTLENPTPWGETPKALLDMCDLPGSPPPVITNLVNQAGRPVRGLIDQHGNYTYYDVLMNKTLYDYILACDLQSDNTCKNTGVDGTRFPAGSVELKVGWKVLTTADKPELYITTPGWVMDPITNKCSAQNLGMVGYHVVVTSEKHPEMIWGTFEHTLNSPDCSDIGASGDWSYYNKDCKDCPSPANSYAFGKPTNVCLVDPQGGGTPDENIPNIKSLNKGYQAALGNQQPYANYKFVGSLWTTDGKPPSNKKNQRGSLKLANSVAETYFQGQLSCFDCHQYSKSSEALQVTHINEVVNKKDPKLNALSK